MAAGATGDHWMTDLFVWNRPAFGEPIDSLLRDIKRFGGEDLLDDRAQLGQRLWALWPQWGQVDGIELKQLAADLRPIRDHLEADARARGWDIQ